jgi:hypothetical protein
MAHQLLHGDSDRKKIDKFMGRLTRAKDNVTMLIGTVDIKIARELKSALDQMMDELPSRPSTPTAKGAGQIPVTSRIVRYNRTSGRAVQLNAPVVKGDAGVDPWAHITQVIVENNVATGSSKQINTSITLENLRLAINILKTSVDEEVEDEEGESMEVSVFPSLEGRRADSQITMVADC